jgi:hypothetical protein
VGLVHPRNPVLGCDFWAASCAAITGCGSAGGKGGLRSPGAVAIQCATDRVFHVYSHPVRAEILELLAARHSVLPRPTSVTS